MQSCEITSQCNRINNIFSSAFSFWFWNTHQFCVLVLLGVFAYIPSNINRRSQNSPIKLKISSYASTPLPHTSNEPFWSRLLVGSTRPFFVARGTAFSTRYWYYYLPGSSVLILVCISNIARMLGSRSIFF